MLLRDLEILLIHAGEINFPERGATTGEAPIPEPYLSAGAHTYDGLHVGPLSTDDPPPHLCLRDRGDAHDELAHILRLLLAPTSIVGFRYFEAFVGRRGVGVRYCKAGSIQVTVRRRCLVGVVVVASASDIIAAVLVLVRAFCCFLLLIIPHRRRREREITTWNIRAETWEVALGEHEVGTMRVG